ncbi:hypothetical protein [Micropruina sp.]|uniref:hypothetical protein n=1 Tax=Micropruina sp. TaxID=2737536 RepID=UPI0039E3C3D4
MSVARQAKLWQWGAVAYVVAASIFFTFMPLLAVRSGDATVWVSPYRMLGWQVFLPLLLPLALTVIPLLARRHAIRVGWVCVGLLSAICLLLALSSGLLFVPAPVLMALGTYLATRAPVEDEDLHDEPWKVPSA